MWVDCTLRVKSELLEDKALKKVFVSVLTPTCGSELWVVTETMRMQIQMAKMRFLIGWQGSASAMERSSDRADPEHAEGKLSRLAGERLGSHRKSWKALLGERRLEYFT